MKLSTKTNFWMVAVLLILTINTYLGFSALRELDRTDQVIAQDFEVALNVRRLRSLLFGYHDYGLTAALTRSRYDIEKRDEYRGQLAEQLTYGLGPGMSPSTERQFERIKNQIEALLAFEPAVTANNKAVSRREIPFLDPSYREQFGATIAGLETLVDHSSDLLAEERQRDQIFYRKNVRDNWIVFGFSFAILLAGFWYFRRRVLLPIQKLIEMTLKIQTGDLTVRSALPQPDELGEMGRTLDQLTAELDRRRRERAEFVGSVVHDLKNPLSAMVLSCDLILKDPERVTSDTKTKLIRGIKEQAERLKRLTEDLLNAAKEAPSSWTLQIQSCHLEKVALDALMLIKTAFPEHQFQFLKESEPPNLLGDPDRLNQVITNLLTNAAKYSPAESTIELAIGGTAAEAFLEVRDRGVGIPDDKKRSIFSAYSRLDSGKEMAEGAGLGLAIVDRIIRAHNGSVSVRDREGGGTVFRIELPVRAVSTRGQEKFTKLAG